MIWNYLIKRVPLKYLDIIINVIPSIVDKVYGCLNELFRVLTASQKHLEARTFMLRTRTLAKKDLMLYSRARSWCRMPPLQHRPRCMSMLLLKSSRQCSGSWQLFTLSRLTTWVHIASKYFLYSVWIYSRIYTELRIYLYIYIRMTIK